MQIGMWVILSFMWMELTNSNYLLEMGRGSARPEVRGTAEPHGGAYPP